MATVSLRVNGKEIPLNPQMQQVFAEVNLGAMRTLKGVGGDITSFELSMKQ